MSTKAFISHLSRKIEIQTICSTYDNHIKHEIWSHSINTVRKIIQLHKKYRNLMKDF